jgi:hypothetical protein
MELIMMNDICGQIKLPFQGVIQLEQLISQGIAIVLNLIGLSARKFIL